MAQIVIVIKCDVKPENEEKTIDGICHAISRNAGMWNHSDDTEWYVNTSRVLSDNVFVRFHTSAEPFTL